MALKDPKLAAILIGPGKKKSGASEGGGEDEADAYEKSDGAQAMADLRDALDAGDDDAAYEAFERGVKLCMASKGDETSEGAAEEEPAEGE